MRFRHSRFSTVVLLWCAALSQAPAQPTQQVHVLPPRGLTNGAFNVGVSAPLGRTYQVTAGTTLSSWSQADLNIVGDAASYSDTSAAQTPQRFFRAGIYWTIMLPNQYLLFFTTNGTDGREIAYPFMWTTNQGRDGRLISYPVGWSTNEGTDGRLIAYPAGWTNVMGPDGRLVAFPAAGFTNVTDASGRIRPHPVAGLPGTNAYVPADWKSVTGPDGRLASYPVSNFPTNTGPDGRLVAYVSTGWSRTNGLDGRMVTYPTNEFTTNTSSQRVDGRVIAYPASGWSTARGPDGRVVAYPAIGTTTVELDFEDQELSAFLGHLRTAVADPDFANFIIYSYFGTGEQRFYY